MHIRQLDILHTTFDRLLTVGECIEVDASCFRNGALYQQVLELEPQDSIIYAAIIMHLKTSSAGEQKCFVSRDWKAFDSEVKNAIKKELDLYNCRFIGGFDQALDFVKAQEQGE
jgi:alpha-acetolactate decarboxylase